MPLNANMLTHMWHAIMIITLLCPALHTVVVCVVVVVLFLYAVESTGYCYFDEQ